MTFMATVKDAVQHELYWPDAIGPASSSWQVVADEDWRRISVGVIRAGGAIVPRAQVRLMGSVLRLLEDEYLRANHMRTQSGDFATYNHFRAQEAAVLDIMMQVREIIRGT
jgi:hypothetical protein